MDKDNYVRFMADVRKASGVESFVPDDSGLVSIRVDDAYNVNFQFAEATGKILCFVEVFELPRDASKSVYRDLLAGGLFGRDTAGGYFAIEPETETVVYNYIFDLEAAAADVDEFISTVEKIIQLCDFWSERIKSDLVGGDDAQIGQIPAHGVLMA